MELCVNPGHNVLALLQTEKVMLSASWNPPVGETALRSEKVTLSASVNPPGGRTVLVAENMTLFASPPVTRQLIGVQSGFSGSEPLATSTPSEKPSPSV